MTTQTAEHITDEGLWTVPEAAEFLGVGRSTIYQLMMDGDLPSAKIRGARRVPVRAVREFAAKAVGGSN